MTKLSIEDKENIVYKVIDQIELKLFHKLIPEVEMCFDCLLQKPKHADHCTRCGLCVEGWQLHSKFLNRCVGEGNARAYFIWVHTSSMLLLLFFLSQYEAYVGTTELSLFYTPFLLFSNLYSSNFVQFLFVILAGFVWTLVVELQIAITYAIQRKMTVNEIKNIYKYKYCFTIKNDDRTGTSYNIHKYYNPCRSVCNIVLFMLNK
jgi:hypothetical protein